MKNAQFNILGISCLLLCLISISSSPAYGDDLSSITSTIFPKSDEFQGAYSDYPMENYTWDKDGFFGGMDWSYGAAKTLLFTSTILIRVGLFLLTLGFHPEMIGDMFAGLIVTAITQSKISFLPRLSPFIALGFIIGLTYDFVKNRASGILQRILVHVTVLGILFIYYSFTASGIQMVSSAVGETSKLFAGAVVSLGAPTPGESDSVGQSFLLYEKDVSNMIWKILVENPWQMGEFGSVDSKIGANDLDAVKKALSKGEIGKSLSVNAETRWADVMLPLPESSDERKALVGILLDKNHDRSKYAFDANGRLFIASTVFFGSCLVLPFLLLMGVLMFVLYFYLLFAILAGVVILPLSLIPARYDPFAVRWWFKTLTFAVVGKILLSLYIGFVFLITILVEKVPNIDGDSFGYGLSMFFTMIWYLLAIVLFFYVYKKHQPIRALNRQVDRQFYRYMPSNPGQLAVNSRFRKLEPGEKLDKALNNMGDRTLDFVTRRRKKKTRSTSAGNSSYGSNSTMKHRVVQRKNSSSKTNGGAAPGARGKSGPSSNRKVRVKRNNVAAKPTSTSHDLASFAINTVLSNSKSKELRLLSSVLINPKTKKLRLLSKDQTTSLQKRRFKIKSRQQHTQVDRIDPSKISSDRNDAHSIRTSSPASTVPDLGISQHEGKQDTPTDQSNTHPDALSTTVAKASQGNTIPDLGIGAVPEKITTDLTTPNTEYSNSAPVQVQPHSPQNEVQKNGKNAQTTPPDLSLNNNSDQVSAPDLNLQEKGGQQKSRSKSSTSKSRQPASPRKRAGGDSTSSNRRRTKNTTKNQQTPPKPTDPPNNTNKK